MRAAADAGVHLRSGGSAFRWVLGLSLEGLKRVRVLGSKGSRVLNTRFNLK